MLKKLTNIQPQPTVHRVGLKRILLSHTETDTNLTQIAITTLQIGEATNDHFHLSMEEYFFFLSGEVLFIIDGTDVVCHKGDFMQVKCGQSHKLIAMKETKMMTIGIQL